MAGNYNYDSLMSRGSFYNEYAPISAWAADARANWGNFRDSHLFTSPGYKIGMLRTGGAPASKWSRDFDQAYSRYNTLFDNRKSATARAEEARLEAIRKQEELRRQAAAEKARLEAEAAARIKASKMTGSAIQASNQILGGGSTNTPTATLTKKQPKQARGARTTGSSLRIGQTANAAGSGSNLSI